VDPDALVEGLPVGVQQRVEIIKALLRDASVLILDEPTAVLTPGEIDDLFKVMRSLKAAGRSIVFITHKLKEVQQMADTITVIRQGRVIGAIEPTASDDALATMMVGRSVQLIPDKASAHPGEVVLAARRLRVANDLGHLAVAGVSFDVHAGEILGIAGVQGNGQTEVCEALMGLRAVEDGSIAIDGKDLTGSRPRDMIHAGVGYVPEDRQKAGLVESFSLAENLALDVYDRPPYSKGLALRLDTFATSAKDQVRQFDVRTESIEAPASSLSGGNQQKVVVARELSRNLKVLIAAQPTRGLDVGSIEFVHRRIVEERDQGTAVLLVSSELDEVIGLSDRIAVMYEGEIVGYRPPSASRQELGLLMAGALRDDAPEPAAAGGVGP
jgi:simple sugar transport system ATP-binding protein